MEVNIVNEIQIGDATNEDFIKSLGVNNFECCVVAVGDNFQTALEITVLLKDFGAEYIIARSES
ncbi:MAG: NAD-binding protein [Coprobacillus cateniformis]